MSRIITDSLAMSDSLSMNNRIIVPASAGKVTQGKLFQKIDNGYGEPILREIASNTVVLGGTILAIEKLTGQLATFKPNTLNDILGIPVTGGTPGTEKIALFGGGTGGSGLSFGSIVAPTIKQNNVLDMIPMRYTSALSGDDANKYFMKKANADGTTSSWYMKEFDAVPVIKSFWKNAVDASATGTEITEDISTSVRTEGIETYAQFEFSLNVNDFYEYFSATGNLAAARYNTFGFYTGEKVNNGGVSEYANVRLYSVIAFNNRDVSIQSSASFVYRVYTLI